MDITNEIAIVTGAASGLGEATARHLAAQGARVGVLDFNIEQAQSVARDIGGIAVQLDVTDEDQVIAAIATVRDHFGGAPRIAVNCAGIANAARIVGREGKTAVPLFRKVIEVNLFGTYNVMTHAAAAMMDQDADTGGERGVIVNTSSAAYQDGQIGQSAYAASKGAVAAMCLPAAREMARSGIRVVAIAPGLFGTPMMQALPSETTAAITANIPFPDRLGHPSEFGQMVGDIVRNPYLNGTTIRLDGAVRLPPK